MDAASASAPAAATRTNTFGSLSSQILDRADSQASLESGHVSRSRLPSGRWETRLHGTCPKCSHFHVSVPLTISRLPGVYNGVRCRKCGAKWFGLGGSSTHSSLMSQQSKENFALLNPIDTNHGIPCSNEHETSPIALIAEAMRSRSAGGSPPPSGPHHPTPVAGRQRSTSGGTAFRVPSLSLAASPISPRRANDGLLSPIAAATRHLQPSSAPVSPILAPQRSAPEVPTMGKFQPGLPRSRSLKERAKDVVKECGKQVVAKFGYEVHIRKLCRPRAISSPGDGGRSSHPALGITSASEDILNIAAAHPLPVTPTTVHGSPNPNPTIDWPPNPCVEYRPTPSGRPFTSQLDIKLRRLQRTIEVSRKCNCTESCHCKISSRPDAPQDRVWSDPMNNVPLGRSTAPGPSASSFRRSLDLAGIQQDRASPCVEQTNVHGLIVPDNDEDSHRLSTADTVYSLSLKSNEDLIDPQDPNLRTLVSDLARIQHNVSSSYQHSQPPPPPSSSPLPLPQQHQHQHQPSPQQVPPQLHLDTRHLTQPRPAREEDDPTPTNRHSGPQQFPAWESGSVDDADSITAVHGGNNESMRSSFSTDSLIALSRHSSITSVGS